MSKGLEKLTVVDPQDLFTDAARMKPEELLVHVRENLRRLAPDIEISDLEVVLAPIQEKIDSLGRELAEAQVAATMDGDTGLANKSYFLRRLEEAVSAVYAGREDYAVLVVDLAGLKSINDKIAPTAGDKAIKVLANMLKHVARHEETVARLGGDEFGIILHNPSMDFSFPKTAQQRIEKYLKDNGAFDYKGNTYPLSTYVAVTPIERGFDYMDVYDIATEKINVVKKAEKHDREKVDVSPIKSSVSDDGPLQHLG